jgi:uncharacterized MAPEG superfamily protein
LCRFLSVKTSKAFSHPLQGFKRKPLCFCHQDKAFPMILTVICLLIAGLMPVFTVAIAKAGDGSYDNGQPRDWSSNLDGYRKRAYAAHLNHYEAFPFFAASVLACLIIQPFSTWLPLLAVLFIIARLAYTAAYVSNQSTLRSLCWLAGWVITILIFLIPIF